MKCTLYLTQPSQMLQERGGLYGSEDVESEMVAKKDYLSFFLGYTSYYYTHFCFGFCFFVLVRVSSYCLHIHS